jgi:hypothetical protein
LGTANSYYPVYNGSIFSIDYYLKKNYSANNVRIKPFIQSFSMESLDKQFMGVRLNDMIISTNLGKVTFYFNSPVNQSKVSSLTLSVIVFDSSSPGILYADGTI